MDGVRTLEQVLATIILNTACFFGFWIVAEVGKVCTRCAQQSTGSDFGLIPQGSSSRTPLGHDLCNASQNCPREAYTNAVPRWSISNVSSTIER